MAHTPELEKLERRYDDDPAKWFAQLAEAYRKYQRVDDAVAILNNHLADRPNYVSALIVLGRCHLDLKKDAEARSAFERVLAIDPENIIALKVMGEVAERSGNPGEAREWLTRLLDVDPANDEARESLDRLGGVAEVVQAVPEPASASEASFGDLASEVASESEVLGFEPTTAEPAAPREALVYEPAALDATAPMSAIPDPAAAFAEPEGITIERASAAMPMPTVEMEPIQLEQSHEAAIPVPAAEPKLVVEPGPVAEFMAEPEAPGDVLAADSQVEIGDVEIEPFDDSLQWGGSGERTSREITAEDIAAAEAARDESLDHSAVEELPGLEGVEVPDPAESHDVEVVEGLFNLRAPVGLEPAAGFEPTTVEAGRLEPRDEAPQSTPDLVTDLQPEAAPATPPASRVGDRGSLAGLPVILPEEESAEPLVGAEPEPVVTETMAELYVQQGLLDEARSVYEQLLAARPGDARLAQRLAALRAPVRATVRPRVSNRFAAAETGGTSARAFLQAVLDGRGTELPAAPPTQSETAMEDAFASEPLEPRGQPTRPASSTYTLGQVFGEESPPMPPAAAPAPAKGGSGFSFDEFFGGAGKPGAPAAGGNATPEEGGDDSFREWLKGLKK